MKKNKLNLPKGVIHNPDMSLPDAIVFMGERIESLEKAMMNLDAQATIRNKQAEKLTHSVAFLSNELSNMNENLYSINQEMNFTDVLAALVITLRKQTFVIAEANGIDCFEEDEEDED